MFRFLITPLLSICYTLLMIFSFYGVTQQANASLLGKSTKKALFVYYEQNATGSIKVNSEAGTLIYTDRLGQIIDPNAPKLLKNIGGDFRNSISRLFLTQFAHTSDEVAAMAREHQSNNRQNIVNVLTNKLTDSGINFGVFRYVAQVFIKGDTATCPSEISWKMIFESNGRHKFTDPVVQSSCFTYIDASYTAYKAADSIVVRGKSNIQLKNAGLLSWKVYRKRAEELYDIKRKGSLISEGQLQMNEQQNFDNIDDNIEADADDYKAKWHTDCLYDVTRHGNCPGNFTYIDKYAQSVSGNNTQYSFAGFKKIMSEFNANYTDLKYSRKLEIKTDESDNYIFSQTYNKRHLTYQKANGCSGGQSNATYETDYYYSYQLVSNEDFYRATQESTVSNFDTELAQEQKGFQVLYENKTTDVTDLSMIQNATLDNNGFLCNTDLVTGQCKVVKVVVNNINDSVLIEKLKDRSLDIVLASIPTADEKSLQYQFKRRGNTQPLAQISIPGGQITTTETPDPNPNNSEVFVCDNGTAGVHPLFNFTYSHPADRVVGYFECNPNVPKSQQRFATNAWGGYDRGGKEGLHSWATINMNFNNSGAMNPYNLSPHWGGRPRNLRSSYSVIDTCNENDGTCGIRFHFGYDGSAIGYMDANYNNYAKMTNQTGDACGSKTRVCTPIYNSYDGDPYYGADIRESDGRYRIYPNYDDNGSLIGHYYIDGYSDGSTGNCTNLREECVATPVPDIRNIDFNYCMGNPTNSDGAVDLGKKYQAIEDGNATQPVNIISAPIN
jgi:hypothetical protein